MCTPAAGSEQLRCAARRTTLFSSPHSAFSSASSSALKDRLRAVVCIPRCPLQVLLGEVSVIVCYWLSDGRGAKVRSKPNEPEARCSSTTRSSASQRTHRTGRDGMGRV